MTEPVKYFGYGANRDPKMISAIIGKPEAELVGKPALLEGYGLGVQKLDQVPDTVGEGSDLPVSPKDILQENWGEDFRSYVIFPEEGGVVSGTIWYLAPDERERVRDWELVGDWYQDAVGTAIMEDGEKVEVITESLGEGQHYDYKVDGREYHTWLQQPERFEEIATEVRKEYDDRNQPPYYKDV